jgi:hypothetical protein
MTRASPARLARRRQRGRPKKQFESDADRGTIDVAEVLHLIGFNRTEAFDLAAAIREGKLVVPADKAGALAFELPVTVKGRSETLRQKCERESTQADSLRRSLLAARLLIANRAETREQAIRALDNLIAIATIGGPEKLRQAVKAMGQHSNKRRARRVAGKAH